MNVSSVCPGISELIGPRLFVNANDDCVICQGELLLKAGKDYGETGPPYVIECGHAFHEECLRRALERSRLCPTCRQPTNAFQQELEGRRNALRREADEELLRQFALHGDPEWDAMVAEQQPEDVRRAQRAQARARRRAEAIRRREAQREAQRDARVADAREDQVRAAASRRYLRENPRGFGSREYGDYIEDAVRRWRAQATEENEI